MRFWLSRVLYHLGWFKLLQFKVRRQLYGKSFVIPQKGKVGYKNLFEWEPWMYEVFHKIGISDGLFLDIGANIGQTLLKVKAVDRNINYIGLEPNPQCYSYINELIAANRFQALTILPVGLSDKSGKGILSLYRDDPTDGMASMIPSIRRHNKVLKEVEIDIIDGSVLQSNIHRKVQTIKIDVEGLELEVMQSVEDIVRKDQPNIFLELLPVYSTENAERLRRQEAIEDLVQKWSYKIYLINFTNNKFVNVEEKPTFGIHGDIHQVDYLLMPYDREVWK